jgi:hypothetical protein
MNSSTGMPLSTWMFLNASSDIFPGCGDAAWAPAPAYPGRSQRAGWTSARSAFVIEGTAEVFEGLAEAAATCVDTPTPLLTNATPISHAIVAPVTTSLIRLDPTCMLSPFLGLISLDWAVLYADA